MISNFITWNANPEILPLGPLSLRWYGILFASSFYFGYLIFKKIFKKEGHPLELLENLLVYLAFGTIIGARLGHVLFYSPAEYFKDPVSILKVWEGGLASHGAAIGILIALYLFVRKYKFNYLWLLDRIAIVIALSGVCIRLGNLMNSEIFGVETSLPWGFKFIRSSEFSNLSVADIPACHPTQIYEAFSYLLIFIFLFLAYNKNLYIKKRGRLFGIFLILLFSARFLIEFIKNPQENFERTLPLDMGQLLSLPFIITGVILIIYSSYQKANEQKLV
jgi:phosphatidylglycerol---prolipoprotein diacylglyceryl transferase